MRELIRSPSSRSIVCFPRHSTHNHNLERKPSINLPQPQSVRVKRRRTSSPPISTTSNPISIPPPASTTSGTSTSVRTPHTVFDSSAESPGLQHLATAATHLARRSSRSPQRSLKPDLDEQYEYRRGHAEGSRSGSTMASQPFASGSRPSGTRDHVQFGGLVQSGMQEPVYTRPQEQLQVSPGGRLISSSWVPAHESSVRPLLADRKLEDVRLHPALRIHHLV